MRTYVNSIHVKITSELSNPMYVIIYKIEKLEKLDQEGFQPYHPPFRVLQLGARLGHDLLDLLQAAYMYMYVCICIYTYIIYIYIYIYIYICAPPA